MSELDLPASVLAKADFSPIEDIALAILREELPGLDIFSLIPKSPPDHFVITRRRSALGDWDGDPRFTDVGQVDVHIFAKDPDGDEKAALIGEAVRVAFRDAWLDHRSVPGRGAVIRIKQTSDPSRKTDWATASGPVQYADLPTGYWRYESSYEFRVRKPNR